VAIGGIKLANIDQIARRGAKTICLVTEIVGATDIPMRINELNTALARYSIS
jgi:thiamine-phosphate pyrophosphorylase